MLHPVSECAIVRVLETEKLVSAEASQDQTFSRDAALIALAHARDQVARSDFRPHSDELIDGSPGPKTPADVKARPASTEVVPAMLSDRSAGSGKSAWRLLVGLGAFLPVGAIVLGWHFLTQRDEIPVSASSVSKELVVKVPSLGTAPADANAVPPKKSSRTEPPSIVSSGTELAQSMVSTTHQSVDTEREMDELKAKQEHMLLENSERDRRLEEAHELTRKNADLIKDLKSAQSQMAQDNANFAAQLKASQDQVATLAAQLDASQIQLAKIAAQTKASQDQVARLMEQKQRPKPLSAASSPASGPTSRPSPKPQPQQARPQTQNPAPAPTR